MNIEISEIRKEALLLLTILTVVLTSYAFFFRASLHVWETLFTHPYLLIFSPELLVAGAFACIVMLVYAIRLFFPETTASNLVPVIAGIAAMAVLVAGARAFTYFPWCTQVLAAALKQDPSRWATNLRYGLGILMVTGIIVVVKAAYQIARPHRWRRYLGLGVMFGAIWVESLITRSVNGPVIGIPIPPELMAQQPVIVPTMTSGYTGKAYPAYFEAAFMPGTRVTQGENTYGYSVLTLGTLPVKTGKIVMGDPINLEHLPAYAQSFPVGEFPFQVALADVGTHNRVALCRVLFSQEPVVRWEFALQPGQPPLPLGDSSLYCFSVDAGTACVGDVVAIKRFNADGFEDFFDYLTEKEENKKNKDALDYGGMYAMAAHQLAYCSTGFGDGCYAVYTGFDASDRPCRLLCDFNLVSWYNQPRP